MDITFQQILDCHPENKRHFNMLDQHLRKGNSLIPFVGAGLSKPVYPLWSEVLRKIASTAGKRHSQKVEEYIAQGKYEDAATYLHDVVRGAGRFADDLSIEFDPKKLKGKKLSEACLMLPQLFRNSVITTNYDRVLETVYESKGFSFEDRCLPRQHYDTSIIDRITKSNRHYLVKLHGDIDNTNTCVLTKENYDEVYGKRGEHKQTEFVSLLRGLYQKGNFIFIGCSLDSDRTLDILRSVVQDGEYYNYAIIELPEETKTDDPAITQIINPATGDVWESLERKEKELSDLRIRCIWYPHKQHSAVAEILRNLLIDPVDIKQMHTQSNTIKPYRHIHGFLGRDKIVDDIFNILQDPNENLLIVCGAPGVGKTEVCREVVNRAISATWPVLTLPLMGKNGYELLLSTLGEALGIQEDSINLANVLAALEAKCKSHEMLLYLDNFEDSLHKTNEAGTEQIDDIRSIDFIATCSKITNLRILASCREDIKGLKNKRIEKLDSDSAVALFHKVWIAGSGDKEILQKEDTILREFINTKMNSHPLSIVLMASQCHEVGSIHELIERWDKEAGKVKNDYSDNPLHKSLNTALSTSFDIIKNDIYCCRTWGILSLFPEGISTSVFEGITNDIDQYKVALSRLIKLNLVEKNVNSIFMLASIKKRTFEYVSPHEPGGENDCINILTEYYAIKLKNANPGQSGWAEMHRANVSMIDDILYFLQHIYNCHQWDAVLRIHNEMSNLYQYRSFVSSQLLDKFINNQEVTGKDRHLLGQTARTLGNLKSRLGAIDEALALYEQAETLFRQDQNNLGLANVLRSMGKLRSLLGSIDEALALYGQAETLYRQEQNNLGLANVLTNMGDLKRRLGAIDEALALYGQAETLYTQERDNLGLANVLTSMGDLKSRLGDIDEALALYGQAETLYTKERDNLGLANVLTSKGDLKSLLGAIDEALALYEQAEALFTQERDNLGLANVLTSMGDLKSRLGDIDEALALYGQAEIFFRQEQNNLGLAHVLTSKGDLKRRLGAIDEPLALYEQAETLFRQEQNNLGLANVLTSMGDLKRRLGAIDEALTLYGQAEIFFRQEQNNLGLAHVLTSKGDLKRRLGAIDEALALYEQAETLYAQERVNLGLANVLKSMGDLKSSLGAIDEALALYGQAETLFTQERDNLGLANMLRSMGDLKSLLGAIEEAHELYGQAETLFRQEQNNLGLANTYQSQGDCFYFEDKYEIAREYYEQSLVIYRSLKCSLDESYVLGELCKTYAKLNLKEALFNTIETLEEMLSVLPDDVKRYDQECISDAKKIQKRGKLKRKPQQTKSNNSDTFIV